MKLRYTSKAKDELDIAFVWYERQRRGLGFEFLVCVEVAIETILHMPKFNQTPLNVGKCWDITIDYLNKINDLAHNSGIELGMVLIPDAIQFDTPSAKVLRDRYEKRGKEINYDWDNPQKELMKLAKQHGWQMLNPLPAMREKSKGSYIYNCTDPHFNAAGNEFLANEVAEWLLNNQLSEFDGAKLTN